VSSEVDGGSGADGALVQQGPSGSGTFQQWRLVREGIQ